MWLRLEPNLGSVCGACLNGLGQGGDGKKAHRFLLGVEPSSLTLHQLLLGTDGAQIADDPKFIIVDGSVLEGD